MSIKNDNNLCGFSHALPGQASKLVKVSSPSNTPDFVKSIYNSFMPEKVTLLAPMLKAFFLYIGRSLHGPAAAVQRAALGKTTKGEWIAEIESSRDKDLTQIAAYNPKTGEVRAGVKNSITKEMLEYAINGNGAKKDPSVAHTSDGTLIWYVLMGEFLKNPEAQSAMTELQEKLDNGKAIADCQMELNILCDNMYCRAVSASAPADQCIEVQNVGASGSCSKISDAKLGNGTYTVSELLKGNFTLVKKNPATSGAAVTLDRSKTDLGWDVPTQGLPFLIKEMKDYIPTTVVQSILKVLKAGREHPEVEIKNFRLVGPPGSGKSEDAKGTAFYGGRPFITQVISSNTTEDELVGILAPSIDDKLGLLSDTEQEAVKAILDLFPTDTEIDIDPEKAYEKLIGKAKTGVDQLEVYAEAYAKAYATLSSSNVSVSVRKPKLSKASAADPAALAEFENELQDYYKAMNGVKYTYVPSPIVLSLLFGFVCEIQEPSAATDPTVLTRMNDVMNKMDGIMTTPIGPVKRHPNTVIIMTDNFSDDIGNSHMNQAVIDRAGAMTFFYKRIAKAQMIKMARKAGITVKNEVCQAIADVVEVVDTEAQKMDNSIRGVAGYRSFIAALKCVQIGFTPQEAADVCIISKISANPEERELLMDIVENNTNLNEVTAE